MKIKKKKLLRRFLQFFSITLFIGCIAFLIYFLGIQPYYSRQVNNKYRDLYYSNSNSNSSTDTYDSTIVSDDNENIEETEEDKSFSLDNSYESGAKNSKGILLKFTNLLDFNKDVKGWLSIPKTKIDYPVLQSSKDSDFYLDHDIEGNTDKNGSLFVDEHCTIKKKWPKNIVIHGHNMETTHMMFYELPKYKSLDYYKKHPIIIFDSIYKEAKWKIISFMRVSGNTGANGSFNYMQSEFEDDEEFLDFLYQIQMRSLYKCPVDVNENDSLLMLSTCSYEIDNYRTVIVARKVRKGEDVDVDTSAAYMRDNVLYPKKWYSKYEGEPPVATSFMEALSFDEIDWYDGELTSDSSIGKVVELDKFEYKITSKTTAKYLCSKSKKLKNLTIPSSIEIDGRKFDVTEISKDAFTDMKKLVSVKIGNKVTEIPSGCFKECSKLESVIIGDSVTSIGKKAFYKLSSLKKIKIRSTSLSEIGDKAFVGIHTKAKIKIPKSKEKKYSKLVKNCELPEKVKLVTFK